MASINKELLKKLADEGFFNDWRTIGEVVSRLDRKGFSLKGKQISLLSQLLILLCQDEILEREKDGKDSWKYKRVGGKAHGN